MELKQMKIVPFAMIKYPCPQDFIRPIPVENLNIYHHKSSIEMWMCPDHCLRLFLGCQFAFWWLLLEHHGSISQSVPAGKYSRTVSPKSKSFSQVPCLGDNMKPSNTIGRTPETVQKDTRHRKDCVYTVQRWFLTCISLVYSLKVEMKRN